MDCECSHLGITAFKSYSWALANVSTGISRNVIFGILKLGTQKQRWSKWINISKTSSFKKCWKSLLRKLEETWNNKNICFLTANSIIQYWCHHFIFSKAQIFSSTDTPVHLWEALCLLVILSSKPGVPSWKSGYDYDWASQKPLLTMR